MYFLKNRVALVTGAAKRIGRALALALAQEGVDVVLHYNTSRDEAENVADEIRQQHGVRAWTLQAGFSDLLQAETLVEHALESAGSLDILINSASIFPQDRVLDFSPERFSHNMQVNALAPLWLSRSFARQEREGVILNLLDTRILDYDREHAAYHLSKRTLYTLTRMLSVELAPNIRVNGIAPGLILAPPGQDEAYLEQRRHTNPLHRIGTLEDITSAALFLLQSDFVTGQILYVDGGRHLKGAMYGT
jgi:NAD(P)-dependent dehydrogenase (short-subunit alcohol dehydrogenase family)